MTTKKFKTRTYMCPRKNPDIPGIWTIGLDIGYSAVKGFAPNKVFCFPAYARKVPEDRNVLKEAGPNDLMFRDETGTWAVGSLAYEEVNAADVMDSETELYGRHRYYSQMFHVIALSGIALALMENQYGGYAYGQRIAVQTGLPPKYERADTGLLKEVLAGDHRFQVKVARGEWFTFEFSISEDDIFVLPQPMGALVSASVDYSGKPLRESGAYFSKNVIVFDPGFGTLDDYIIDHGNVVGSGETFPEYGMREVFARTCRDIYREAKVDIQVAELQNKLDEGTVYMMDRKAMKRTVFHFDDLLAKNCRDVCMEAIEKMKTIHNYFQDTNYIIATGGTYEAWKDEFDRCFQDMVDLKIVPANVNDTSLSNVFSNVRGYYFYLLNQKGLRS